MYVFVYGWGVSFVIPFFFPLAFIHYLGGLRMIYYKDIKKGKAKYCRTAMELSVFTFLLSSSNVREYSCNQEKV